MICRVTINGRFLEAVGQPPLQIGFIGAAEFSRNSRIRAKKYESFSFILRWTPPVNHMSRTRKLQVTHLARTILHLTTPPNTPLCLYWILVLYILS
jgi:hypothetical protein